MAVGGAAFPVAPQEGNPDARCESLPHWVSAHPLPSISHVQEPVPAGGDRRSGRAISAVPRKTGSISAPPPPPHPLLPSHLPDSVSLSNHLSASDLEASGKPLTMREELEQDHFLWPRNVP